MTGVPTARLTAEELAELAELEGEEIDRREAEKIAVKRQHLEALRLAKKLAASHGKPGSDFVVLETTVGNIAVRRPLDVEIDKLGAESERADLEALASAIVLFPTSSELQGLMAQHHGLVGAVVAEATKLLKVLREEEVKK